MNELVAPPPRPPLSWLILPPFVATASALVGSWAFDGEKRCLWVTGGGAALACAPVVWGTLGFLLFLVAHVCVSLPGSYWVWGRVIHRGLQGWPTVVLASVSGAAVIALILGVIQAEATPDAGLNGLTIAFPLVLQIVIALWGVGLSAQWFYRSAAI